MCVAVLRLQLSDIGLGGVGLSLKRRLFKLIKEIAFFDFRAFNKQPLFEKRRNSCDDRDSANCLDPADEFIGLCYLLPLGPDYAYSGRACRLLCGSAICEPTAEREQDKNCRKPVTHLMLRCCQHSSDTIAPICSQPSLACQVDAHPRDRN